MPKDSAGASAEGSAEARAAGPRGRGARGAGDDVEASRMTLGEHLDELRKRLVWGILAVVVAFGGAWAFKEPTYQAVTAPLRQAVGMLNLELARQYEAALATDPSVPRTEHFLTDDPADARLRRPIEHLPITTGVGEAFLVYLKSALYMALFLGGPILLWQMWLFVAAGLYAHERRTVLSYFPTSLLLFFVGIAFGYFVMVPYSIYFLNATLSLVQFRPEFRAAEYFAFLSSLCLGLGAVFQLPIVMTAVARVGIVEVRTFRRFRGHFVLAAFVIGAVLTPPDPFTQFMMAVPMIVLYELGILTAALAARRRRRESPEAAPAEGAA